MSAGSPGMAGRSVGRAHGSVMPGGQPGLTGCEVPIGFADEPVPDPPPGVIPPPPGLPVRPPGTANATPNVTAATAAAATRPGPPTRRTSAARRCRAITASTSTVDGGGLPIASSNSCLSIELSPYCPVVPGNRGTQRVEPPRGLALHGSGRAAEDLGGLLHREVAVEPQHDDRPPPRWQRREQIEQLRPPDHVELGRCRQLGQLAGELLA